MNGVEREVRQKIPYDHPTKFIVREFRTNKRENGLYNAQLISGICYHSCDYLIRLDYLVEVCYTYHMKN